MSHTNVERVVIVGGGTAGWMAAAGLAKLLPKSISVCLVESNEIPTVGVGEATIPTLQTFHDLLEISEREFMIETHATFKLGIDFVNWRDENHNYIHSFGAVGENSWAAGFHHFWKKGQVEGISGDYGDYCLEQKAAEQGRFSHSSTSKINYAYHIDAGLYAGFLRKFSERLGVRRIEGKVVDVRVNKETQFIESLELKSGIEIDGDLFIDCTGFCGLLIGQALDTGYEDWSHWLPCDTALAVQTSSTKAPLPYTSSFAKEAGWQWRIPLQSRVGNGLVYCSQYISDEDATNDLLSSIDGALINDPRKIKFQTGQREKHWHKNCVALGLSSGFIEPLESTSIHLIMRGVMRLVHLFPANGIHEAEVNEFNSQARREAELIRDFIILHYHMTERRGEFWDYCRNMPVPDSLLHRLELFKKSGKFFRKHDELFGEYSWVQVMLGQGLTPGSYHPVADHMSADELGVFLGDIRAPIDRALRIMPSHSEYIERYCKANC